MLTLVVLSILVLLLVSFLASMGIERRAAAAFEDSERAKLVAQGAVSHAVDLLRTNIPEPARLSEGPATAPGENWAVNPGQLTVVRNGQAAQRIPLHTGEVVSLPKDGSPRDADSVDLNQPLPGETMPVITGAAGGVGAVRPPMRVQWVNLLPNPAAPASQENRLTARYAFWVDDECARLNFNTALGKPAAGSNMFGTQLNGGFTTPLFTRGDGATLGDGSGARKWALGRPQSVNLDVLFTQPSQLKHDALLANIFLRGYARYPEAILDFIDVTSPRDWYAKNKFALTFYNRSPEFNAFGKSRLFTTYIPLSLEAGPAYQHPFIYDPGKVFQGSPNEILHLNSLLGNMGFTDAMEDDENGGTVNGGNVVNRAQVEMLLGYLKQQWPGYAGTFLSKYGEAECRQIALNALLIARMATANLGDDLSAFSHDWSFRSTSVNYSPASGELAGRTPERFYWRFQIGGKEVLMLPQTPGPHISEVRLFAKAIPGPIPTQRYLQYWYEVKYYMHPFGPVVDIAEFPVRMDYLDLEATGPGQTTRKQQFGPTDKNDDRAAKNWNSARNLARLATLPAHLTLGPQGATYNDEMVPNRRVVSSPRRVVGTVETVVPDEAGTAANDWSPAIFDATKGDGTVKLTVRFRPGMGVLAAPGRPRQMIPLGESQADTLQALVTVNLKDLQEEQAYSWQIRDPRLSHLLTQWVGKRIAAGPHTAVATPATANADEPAENSTEKSKFRSLQRAPTGAQVGGYALDRPDEYNTAGRTASPGYWSLLHTGMQSAIAWRTLDFHTASQASPPDWLLLDLFGATYPMAHDQWKIGNTLPDAFSTASYMGSTAGQVNLNSRIFPETPYFRPPARTKPLEAVFKNLRSDGAVKSLVDSIAAHQQANGSFGYVGELANVPNFAQGATQWEKESLLRNMAGCLTTRSNTFGVWGAAQVIKKVPRNKEYDRFEKGDQVAAEKRFYALVERYVWQGRDGVPGNGHLSTAGKWDRLAVQRANITTSAGPTNTLFQLPGSPPLVRAGTSQTLNLDNDGSYPEVDGPETVGMNPYAAASLGALRYRPSRLEDAYNPPQALIKYRVVYFKYLDQ